MLDTVLAHVETILSTGDLSKADPDLANFLLDTLGNVVLPSIPTKDGENGWEGEMESHLAVRSFPFLKLEEMLICVDRT